MMFPKLRYFTDAEVEGLDPAFARQLDRARLRAGVPFKITSGYRSPAENRKLKGAKRSSHVMRLGVDIRVRGSHQRFLIIRALILAGFTRIGVYSSKNGWGHIHVDAADRVLPPEVMWTGKSK